MDTAGSSAVLCYLLVVGCAGTVRVSTDAVLVLLVQMLAFAISIEKDLSIFFDGQHAHLASCMSQLLSKHVATEFRPP